MKKGSDNSNLGVSLIKSVTQSGAGEIARDVSEMALDSILDEGLLKDVPVFGLLAKFYAVAGTVRDHIFLKKVASFLFGTSLAPQGVKDKFRETLDADPGFCRKVGENLILLLERHDHFDKSLLLGRVFSEYLNNRINYEHFLRIASSIDRVPITDLNQLSSYKDRMDSYDGTSRGSFANALNADTCQSLYTSGLVTSGSAFETTYQPNEVMKLLVDLIGSYR